MKQFIFLILTKCYLDDFFLTLLPYFFDIPKVTITKKGLKVSMKYILKAMSPNVGSEVVRIKKKLWLNFLIYMYSSNKIRNTQNEHLNVVCQNLNSQLM